MILAVDTDSRFALCERVAIEDIVGERPAAMERDGERRFGKAVARLHRVGTEAVTGESLAERAQRTVVDRFGAAHRPPQRRQVHAL